MADATADPTVPRSAVIAASVLIAAAIAAAAFCRWTGIGAARFDPTDHSVAVRSLLLRFEDRPDGGVAVVTPDAGERVAVIDAGTDGFVRTVLRSLAYDRHRHNIGSGPAFAITRWSDGRLTLDDPATGRRVDLAAFGAANMRAFETWDTAQGVKP